MLALYGPENARLYYSHTRPEILRLIPPGARRLLDVGCGTGALGATVKARQECYYAGIDLDESATLEAENVLDFVICDNVEKVGHDTWRSTFDCIILADILEHLKDPLDTLLEISKDLEPNGTIIVSLPNISHPHIVRELASGLFRYTNAGILDKTHLRFFTNISAQQMFASARLRVTGVTAHPSDRDPQQYIYTLKKLSPSLHNSQLTVLLLALNQRDTVIACANSLRRSSPSDKIILFLDNGSTDETITWLRAQEDVLSIRSDANLGYTTGNNLLLPCVTTPYFLLSNTDTLYPRDAILDLFDAIVDLSPHAIVGPSGPNVSGYQNCAPLSFSDFKTLDQAYSSRKDQTKSRINRIHRLVFFSALFPTQAISDIGLLDELFSPGNFEDDDYCLRAIEKGYSLYHIPYVHVHHYGGEVFRRNPSQYYSLLRKNITLFKRKWDGKRDKILKDYYSPPNTNEI